PVRRGRGHDGGTQSLEVSAGTGQDLPSSALPGFPEPISMIHRLITVVFIVLAALPAYAAEETEGLSPFAGNVGNAVWTLTIFVIVVAVLGKFAWGPILTMLQDR